MSKYLAFFVLAVLVACFAGCAGGGSDEPTVIPIHPPTTGLRVETPMAWACGDEYDQGAYLVGTQTWRVYGRGSIVLAPVEQSAIEVHGPFHKDGYDEWILTALSSWRTDLNVLVDGNTAIKMFVVTERVDPARVVVNVEGANRVGDSNMFFADQILVGGSIDLIVSWSCGEGWPQLQDVPVLWDEFPAGVTVQPSSNGRRLHIIATSPGSAEFIGNIAGVYFRIMLPVSLS